MKPSPSPPRRARLALVGVGHAHMEVLRRLIEDPQGEALRRRVDLTVISLSTHHHYSGMVPGFLSGTYREEQIAFHLPPLVEKAGGRFVRGRATQLLAQARRVQLEGGEAVPYDLVSFNVGSRAAGQDRADVRQHATAVKPMSRAVELARALRRGARSVAVVGAGAAGYEVACAAARINRDAEVTLVDAGDRILPGYSACFRARAESVLRRKGIAVRTAAMVTRVEGERIIVEGGKEIPTELTIWLTGATALPLFEGSGLPVDSRGFLLIDHALRSVADPTVFAVGDCGTLADHPETPKAGVYAVRQGPVLWQSLLAALEGSPPPRYVPQDSFLSILNTADGKALLRYEGVISWSRWAWWLKDWIDRRFMEKYQRLF